MFYTHQNMIINLNMCSQIVCGRLSISFYTTDTEKQQDVFDFETPEECQKEWNKILNMVGK